MKYSVLEDRVNEPRDGAAPESSLASPAEPAEGTPADRSVIQPSEALAPIGVEDLPAEMRGGMARVGWTRLMPVQSAAIPYVLARRDLIVQSRTGSGKTGAFVLPMLTLLDAQHAGCQALVLVPTRELCAQVSGEAERLAAGTGLRVAAVYGGVSYGPQVAALRGGAHIVVGTPGRVLDHLMNDVLSLTALRVLVVDEADRLLSMGFYPDMKRLQRYLPDSGYATYLFSATFPPLVHQLARLFMRRPDFLSLSHAHVHVAETEHVYYVVPALKKDRALVRIIEVENPQSAIIFCNTKNDVHYVTVVLQRFGYDADEITSDLAQAAREKVLQRIRTHRLRFLVATDVAARGIDIPYLSHVIQYDVPEDAESYVHRAGRTGRAGASGVCITLVTSMEKAKLAEIAARYRIELTEEVVPGDEEVGELVAERTIALLEARLRGLDRVEWERLQRFLPLARSLNQTEDGCRLMAMLLDAAYVEGLRAYAPEGGEARDGERGVGTRRGRRRARTSAK
ncbi:MAG: DEAD/DEAH box helicase [bacterium]|nr:DEAD/DEAH box helicase [bacterium]